jgi:hypothetical protein
MPGVFATCLAFVLAASGGASDDPDRYVIETQVIVTDRSFTMEAHSASTDTEVVSVGDVDTMTIGDEELDLAADWIWGSEAGPPEDSGIELLTAPRMVVPAGERAQLRSGAAVQYLEQRDDDCFTLETLSPEASPGVYLEVKPVAGPRQDDLETVDLDYMLRVSTIAGREVIPGVGLDVGRPTIQTKEVSSRHRCTVGRWSLLTTHISRDPNEPETDKLIVLIRVSRPPT